MCMEAFDDSEFAEVVNDADLVVADGRPLVWAQRMLGHDTADQVRGQNLTLSLCHMSEMHGLKVGFFGGSNAVLNKMLGYLSGRYPNLAIAYANSPPFRPLTEEEISDVHEAIRNAEVDILFVGLGCPKQERWMAKNRPFVGAVMVGVGAAFDFIAGEKMAAPRWVQKAGLEWLLRFASEPRRLWRRYTRHNPRFLWHFAGQYLSRGRN
jgi:N-acetylglucosaminyldiphosphoundecaprenol N-acetyl-beta-D-mannosaminyltransferase